MNKFASEIYNWIPTMVAVGALGVIWLDIRSFKKKIFLAVDTIEKDIKKSLYDETGITRYIPRSECVTQATACQKLLCSKIEELKKSLAQANQARESARDQYSMQMEKIATHMGRVEQYIKDNAK